MADGSRSGPMGESFGQKPPPLYEMIRNILREYPSGQIFKEVIQNADDARATEVKFFLDCRHRHTLPHTLDGTCLSNEQKDQYSGPALLSYNNAPFKKEDWQSIQSLYQSGKAKNPHKVGKFGIGFNSVYHVTDIPVILSQDYCGFLEPQERVWRDTDSCRGESGRGFYLRELSTKCPEVLDQFHNICGFSKTHSQFANQTLLRFPLRTKASKLSSDVYTIDKLRELLEPLKEEVQYLLVYLRSVCSIEISQIETNGSMTSILKVSIDQSEIAHQRQQLVQSVETTFSGSSPYSVRKVLTDVCHFNITLEINGSCNSKYNWLVVNQVGSEDSEVLQLAEKQHVLPWVGTAIEMSQQPSEATAGRIFCVLPLPVEDRAPFCVHVNGTFAVSSNRRSLKWEVQERRGDEEGAWNKLLVNKCLPSCYVKLVSKLMDLNERDPTLVYSCWPNIQQVSYTPWNGLLQPFYTSLLQYNTVLHTPLEDGKWISVNNSVFITNIPQPVNDALLQCNVSLVEVNDNCTTALRQYYNGSRQVLSPSIARSHLKRNPISYVHMSKENKIAILQYCLSDRAYNDIIGLQLLPLANGTFGQFQGKYNLYSYSSIPEVYLCTSANPCTLLPGIENRLVSVYNDDTMLHSVLQSVAQSGHTQLTLLGVTQVANLVSQCSTSSWSQQQMTYFWQWLGRESLNEFSGKPIVPVKLPNGGSTVVSLNKQAGVVYIPPNTYSVSQEVVSALNKCGIKFADSREFNYLVHSQLRQYLYQYEQPNDVLDALQSVSLSYVTFTASESVAIQEFFSSVDFRSAKLNTICTLPVFTSLQSSTRYCINSMKTSCCNDKAIAMSGKYDFRTDLLPSNPLIINTQENNFNLLSKLKTSYVEFLSGTEFLQRVAFQLIRSRQFTNVVPFMISVLENFYIFQRASSKFSNTLRSLPFVKSQSSTLTAPCNLYDPEDVILNELFKREYNKFPSSQFHAHLPILRQCGLKTSVDASDILQIVTTIQNSLSYYSNGIECVQSTSYTRAVAVLRYLSSNPNLFHDKVHYNRSLQQALINLARQYCWLPVVNSQPDNYPSCLEWKGSNYKYGLASTKYAPLIVLSQNENINSSQLPMIVGSQAVFIENVPNSLATNLSCSPSDLINGIVSHFQQVIENEVEIPAHLLCRISIQTYKYLSNNIGHCRQNVLTGKWIWMENLSTFVDSSQVAIDAHPSFRTSLEPFIYTIPSNFKEYSNLLIKCGVNQQITISQITFVLNLIQNSSELTLSCESAWSIIRAILEWLVSDDTRLNEAGDVLVPVERDDSNDWPQLLPSSQVAYTDNDMLREIAKGSVDEEYHILVHPKVSHLSSSLGLTPLSDHLDITEDVFEDAGQHEPLVTRLANILREYKDGLTIIKEMIQNADDAGATEVNILYDNRTHPSQNLLFKGMAQCHGPALIVHNDSTFTKEDFENITKLAGATKANQLLKIGKFGVGFCSVYHITDVPSFVSGEWLYIFDPTLQYLKGVVRNENRPGKKIKYQSKFLSNSKQLVPYEGLFNFTSSSTYNGTMFRLPFRTCSSQISSTIYNDHMIAQMKEALQSNGSQLLLFLQNVKKITFSSINSSCDKVSIECSLTSHNIGRCITTSVDDDLVEEKWLVCTQSDNIRVATGDYKPATASVACQLVNTTCQPINGAVFCYLPLAVPNTGLPVHVSANFAVMSNRSGIWTDPSGGVASDSREAWNQQLMETVIPKAYIKLLLKLKEMALSGEVTLYDFHSLWPLEGNLQMRHPWDKLITTLYNLISQESLFHSVSTSQWLTLARSQFLPSSLFHEYISMDTLTETVTKLQLPVVSLPSQYFEQIQKVRPKVKVTTEYEFTEEFLSNINLFTDSIETRNNVLSSILSTVGIELSQVGISGLTSLLQKYKCIPCSPNGTILELANNLVDPIIFCDMFDPEDSKFPLDTFYRNRLINSVIISLGLMRTNIPWAIIVDCAKTVEALYDTNKEKALKRIKILVSSINEKKSNADLPDELRDIPFLPVLQKPDRYILPWKAEGHKLLPPCQVISVDRSDLTKFGLTVGSQLAIVNTNYLSYGGCGSIPHNVLTLLEISNRPSLDCVLEHFQCLIDHLQTTSYSDQDSIEHIGMICRHVYKFFDVELKNNSREVVTNQLETVLRPTEVEEKLISFASNNLFVWTGSCFVKTTEVAKNWKRNGPYLYKLTDVMTQQRLLVKALNICDDFDTQKLLDVLSELYETYSSEKLPEELHEFIDTLMTELNTAIGEFNRPIFLCDNNYMLRPVSELGYNDAQWLPVSDDCHLVHKRLSSRERVLEFGVQAVRSRYLDGFVNPTAFSGVEFGQSEKLTQRIKNILRDYPLDVTFIKELLQNADDAKATKMTVILDKRQHGTEKLLSEKWEELQGPAVLVWNDKDFSDKDLKGIQRLGLGSKRDDHESIGQFGIGFNVVYHLTDCPSFITHGGNTLCVFDPHCKYVQGASLLYPGRQYDNLNGGDFWDQFEDLRSCYFQDTLPNQPGYLKSGSLFRYPLRSKQELLDASKILEDKGRDNLWTASKMDRSLTEWVNKIEEALLFLNHITQFEFYVIENYTRKFELRSSYHVTLNDHAVQSRKDFQSQLVKFKETLVPDVVTYSLTLHSSVCPTNTRSTYGSSSSSSVWIIQRGVGDLLGTNQEWKYIKQVLPKHGIAVPLNNPFLFRGKVFCFLPLPISSNLPVHVNGQFVLSGNRRSLWSGDESSDKLKWNRQLIEAIASSYVQFLLNARSYIVKDEALKGDDFYKAINRYYQLFPYWLTKKQTKPSVVSAPQPSQRVTPYSTTPSLLTVAPISTSLSCNPTGRVTHSTPSSSDTVAPTVKPTQLEGQWLTLGQSVFKKLWSGNVEILATEIFEGDNVRAKWCILHNNVAPFSQAYFQPKVKEILPVLRKLGMTLTCAPFELYRHFKEHDPFIAKPIKVFDFYSNFHTAILGSGCPVNVSSTPFKEANIFVQFLKYVSSGAISRHFPVPPNGLPLLLTADEQIRCFDEKNKVICSCFTKLFPNSLASFLHPKLLYLNLSKDYFYSPVDVKFYIVNKLFEGNFSQELNEAEVNNSREKVIKVETLKLLWSCISTDKIISQHRNDILNHWALLPSTNCHLYRANSAVLPIICTEVSMGLPIFVLLRDTLHIPILDVKIHKDLKIHEDLKIHKDMSKYCPQLFTHHDRVFRIIYSKHSQDQIFNTVTLSDDNINILLDYFSRTNFRHDRSICNQIKCLPIFKTVNGILTSLLGKSVYLQPSPHFCIAGYEKWALLDNVVFLQLGGSWMKLCGSDFTLLGEVPDEIYIYSQLIFPNFHKLTPEERMQHLVYIKDYVYDDACHDAKRPHQRGQIAAIFLANLASLKCLPYQDTLMTIGSFCDHTVEIFTTFREHFIFLSEEYSDESWLVFFRKLDLQTTVQFDMFIKLADQVSRGGHDDLEKASDVLLSYVFSKNAEKWHDNKYMMYQIGDISFVKVAKLGSYSWIKAPCSPPNDFPNIGIGLTKLNEAVVSNCASLVWTVKPVVNLPVEIPVSMKEHNSIKSLGVCTAPNVKDVYDNIVNISRTGLSNFQLFSTYHPDYIHPSDSDRAKLVNIMIKCIGYLGEKAQEKEIQRTRMEEINHINELLKQLVEVPCVPVPAVSTSNSLLDFSKPVLVKPLQVVRVLISPDQENLAPYIHAIPSCLNSILLPLETMGVCQEINLKHLQLLLYIMRSIHCDGIIANPNEINVMRKAISKMDSILSNYTKQQLESQLESLCLPTQINEITYKLVSPSKLVFADTTRFKVNEFNFESSSLSLCKIPMDSVPYRRLIEKDFCLKLPKNVRPKGLSLCTIEHIIIPNETVQTSAIKQHFIKLKELINTRFSDVMKSLVIGCLAENNVNQFVDTFVDTLNRMILVAVNNLEVNVQLLNDHTDIGTAKAKYSLQSDSKGQYTMYCDAAETISPSLRENMAQSFCIEVGRSLKRNPLIFFKCRPILVKLLEVQCEEDLEKLAENQLVQHTDDIDSSYSPKVGQRIPPQLVAMLSQDINHIYRPQELVGYTREDEEFIWAIVLYPIEEENSSETQLKRYAIAYSETEVEPHTVSAIDLYKVVEKRQPDQSEEKSLVPSEDTSPANAMLQKARVSRELLALKKKICKELRLTWSSKLTPSEKRRAIRRMYLNYHPDKVTNNRDLYEEAFKYLTRQIDRLENGLPLEEPEDEKDDEPPPTPSHWHSMFENWRDSLRRQNSYSGGGGGGGGGGGWWGGYSPPVPDPEEAKRWLRQAHSDLRAMKILHSGLHNNPTLNPVSCQVIFMAHEVIEKSLKAGMYFLIGINSNSESLRSHNLTSQARAISSQRPGQLVELPRLTSSMEDSYLDTRYPNPHSKPKAPVDIYEPPRADSASDAADRIYELINNIIG